MMDSVSLDTTPYSELGVDKEGGFFWSDDLFKFLEENYGTKIGPNH